MEQLHLSIFQNQYRNLQSFVIFIYLSGKKNIAFFVKDIINLYLHVRKHIFVIDNLSTHFARPINEKLGVDQGKKFLSRIESPSEK